MVTEIDLPGVDGIQLHDRMVAAQILLPVVMVAAESDVAVAVRAMKSGVIDFLQKPCHPLELWEAIQHAIEEHRVRSEAGEHPRSNPCAAGKSHRRGGTGDAHGFGWQTQ